MASLVGPDGLQGVEVAPRHVVTFPSLPQWLWKLLVAAVAIAMLVFLILLWTRPHKTEAELDLDGPLPVQVLGPVELATPEEAWPVMLDVDPDAPPLPVQGNVSLSGPLGSCGLDEALCVTLSAEQGPVPVDLGNQTVGVQVVGPLGACAPDDALCVTGQVEVTGGTVSIGNDTLAVEVVGPTGQCSPDDALCVTVSGGALAISNDTLAVEVVGPVGQCSPEEALCVGGEVQVVNVPGGAPLNVSVVNESLNISATVVIDPLIDANIVGPLGACAADDAVCITLAQNTTVLVANDPQAGPLDVQLVGSDVALQVEVINELTLEGVGTTAGTGECAANSSLCVSIDGQSTPLQVTNVPGESVNVTVANLADLVVNVNSTLQLDAADLLQVNVTNPSLLVNISGPLGGDTPVEQAVSVTLVGGLPTVEMRLARDGNATDLFGRQRVSNARNLFDYKALSVVDEVLNFDNQQVSGSMTAVSFSPQRASIIMSVGNLVAGHRVRQTLRRFYYQPGNTHVIYMTVRPDQVSTGIIKQWGCFDEQNGVFFELSNNYELFAVIRSSSSGSPVDTRIDIAPAVPVGFSPFDVTLWVIEFAWLGAVNLRFSLQMGATQHLLYETSLPADVVWTSSPTLPLRFDLQNNGTGLSASLEMVSAAVRTDGAGEKSLQSYSVDRGITRLSITTDGLLHPLVGARLRPGDVKTAVALLSGFSQVALNGNVIFRWALLYRPTIGGPVVAWSSRAESPIESAQPTAANTCSGGQQYASGYVVGTSQTSGGVFAVPGQVYLGSYIDGTAADLWLCVQRMDNGQGSDNIIGGMTFLVAL